MIAGTHWRPDRLLIADDDFPLPPDLDIPSDRVDTERLAELCGSREHQGAAARLPPYPMNTVASLLARSPQRVVVLDRIQYANNFGTILRSAEVFGFDGCLIADRGQCGVTAAIGRLSAGAVFRVPIAQTGELAAAIGQLREAGIVCWSTSPEAGTRCSETDFGSRAAIVIGAEHDGVQPAIAAACDGTVTIPQIGQTQSLNAASSAAVLMYEIARRSGSAG